MCLRAADVQMYWRFAAVMRHGLEAGWTPAALQESYDEIASIALHTKHDGLRQQCESLMAEFCAARDAEITREPFYDDLQDTSHAVPLVAGALAVWLR